MINKPKPSIAPLALFIGALTPGLEISTAHAAIEETLVTAQRRDQSIQETPVSVTAFDATQLEEQGVLDITELQKSSPNTTLTVSRGTNSTLTAYIRGVGQADPLWGFEPGVGLYIDDVYVARPQAGVLDVYEVDRIEVLRGPQGTLYGKNTIGGAVKYVTKRLSGENELSLRATVGNYNQRDFIVSGETALVEGKLYVGGSVASLQRDGFGEFLQSGDENYNKDILSGRLSLEYIATENLWFRLAADSTDDDSNAKGGHRLTPSLRVPDEEIPADVFDSNSDMDTNNEVESSGVSLTATWDLNSSMQLKSISAYREGETFTNIDFDNTSLPSLHVPAIYEDDQFTQEFQLSYNTENFHLISGIYYYEGTASGAFDVLLGAFDSADFGNFNAVTAGTVDTESIAIYGHGTFDFTDRLSATLGLRYTRDDKEAEVFRSRAFVNGNSTQLGGSENFVIAVDTDYTNDDSWSEVSPRLSVDYIFSDDVLGYASYSRGFKSGGFDMRGNAALLPSTVDGYDPETVDTIELGLKTQFWDDRVRLNTAIFGSAYEDVQSTVQSATPDGTTFASDVLNAGEAEVFGLEIEMIAQLTDNLNLVSAIGYTNAEFTEVLTEETLTTEDGPVVVQTDVSDSWEFPFTPEWNGNVRLTYFTTLGSSGNLSVNLSASYRDEVRIFPQVESLVDEDSYVLVDASVVWTSADEHWSVGLHGKNLSDKEYRVGGYNFIGLGLEDSVIGYYGNPRTVSLTASYRL